MIVEGWSVEEIKETTDWVVVVFEEREVGFKFVSVIEVVVVRTAILWVDVTVGELGEGIPEVCAVEVIGEIVVEDVGTVDSAVA